MTVMVLRFLSYILFRSRSGLMVVLSVNKKNYNLNGQQVEMPRKGLYIQKGKKIVK